MQGKWVAGAILAAAALVGGGVWYMQEVFYYTRLPAASVALALVPQDGGAPVPLQVSEMQAIDASSSPIRFRACFTTTARPQDLAARFIPYGDARPLNAPFWFGCFDAAQLTGMLERGEAQAFLARADDPWGIDHLVAVDGQGHGWAWPQINECGRAGFDGKPLPRGCSAPPER